MSEKSGGTESGREKRSLFKAHIHAFEKCRGKHIVEIYKANSNARHAGSVHAEYIRTHIHSYQASKLKTGDAFYFLGGCDMSEHVTCLRWDEDSKKFDTTYVSIYSTWISLNNAILLG